MTKITRRQLSVETSLFMTRHPKKLRYVWCVLLRLLFTYKHFLGRIPDYQIRKTASMVDTTKERWYSAESVQGLGRSFKWIGY